METAEAKFIVMRTRLSGLVVVLLMMINKQAITAAKALVLSFRACRSFMNMQFSPQKFSGQTHR
jgi:hypothetical protein